MTYSTIPTSPVTRISTRLVLLSVLAIGIGQSMTFTLLAPLGREVGFGEVQIGLIITCSSLAFTVSSPIWGGISDHWGRKPVLLLGLFGYTLGCFLFASVFFYGLKGLLADEKLYLFAIVLRVLIGSLMSAVTSAALAYTADTTDLEQRVAGMGRLWSGKTLGAILGPGICGLFAALGLLAPLYVSAGITLFIAVIVVAILQEPSRATLRPTNKSKFKLFDKRYCPYILVGFLTFFAFSITSQTIGFYIQDRFLLDGKATAQALGTALVVAASASLFSQLYLSKKMNLNPVRLMTLGLLVLMVGYASLLFASGIVVLVVFLGIVGLGLGMVKPGFAAGFSLAVGPEEQGAVSGMIASCQMAGFVLGPVVGASMYQLDHNLPYLCASVLMLLLAVHVWRAGRIDQGTHTI